MGKYMYADIHTYFYAYTYIYICMQSCVCWFLRAGSESWLWRVLE